MCVCVRGLRLLRSGLWTDLLSPTHVASPLVGFVGSVHVLYLRRGLWFALYFSLKTLLIFLFLHRSANNTCNNVTAGLPPHRGPTSFWGTFGGAVLKMSCHQTLPTNRNGGGC